jgi:TRAP transporter TAXI family solute receptor
MRTHSIPDYGANMFKRLYTPPTSTVACDQVRRLGLLAGLFTALTGSRAQAQAPVALSLGTATPGGGFPVYGEALAKIINASGAGLRIEPRNTKGSYENMPLLESGQLDIALVAGEPAFEALNGIKGPAANLRIIAAMYSTPGMFVVLGNSPYRTIADLKGQSIAFGAKGSGLPILARYVLDGMGLDQERDFKAIYLDKVSDAPLMLRDGRVAAVWGGGTGWPTFELMMKEGGRFIAPTAQDIARIRAKHGYLGDLILPANSYAGQGEAIRSVGSWSFILARPTLDDALAYRLTRALHLNEKAFAQLVPQARESTAANTVAATYRPELLHAGARKYLQEIGLLK